MPTSIDKTQQPESRSVMPVVSGEQTAGEGAFQPDYRPEAAAGLQLQQMVNASPQVRQFRAYQQLADDGAGMPIQSKANHTGLPDQLKSGIEQLSGYSMDDVKVHYHSDKPAQVQAHAYAQGTDIHIASGQEQHLPHEAWHVVQQKQDRVRPTLQLKEKVAINDDAGLEREADVMGAKAASGVIQAVRYALAPASVPQPVVQRTLAQDLTNGAVKTAVAGETHDEIPADEEKAKWATHKVTVLYESDAAADKHIDPPTLRAGHLWNFFYRPTLEFWQILETTGVVSIENKVTMDAHRVSVAMLQSELEIIGLGVDQSLDEAYGKLGLFLVELPADNAILGTKPRAEKTALAKKKIVELYELNNLLRAVHGKSSFSDVDFNEQSLMEERSKEMLKNITEAGLTKTVYKIGNEHVDDIRRLKIKPAAGIKVLSKAEYQVEYDRANVFRMPGNREVSSVVGNDEL